MSGTTVISRIRAAFEARPGDVFLIESMTRRRWTYGEFHDWALRAATLLRRQGIGKGDRVALVLANSAEFAALYFGCMFIGAVAVPVNQSLHHREIKYILSHCGARLLLFSRCTRPLVLQATEGLTQLRQLRVMLGQEQVFHPEDVEDTWNFEQEKADPSLAPLEGVSDDDLLVVLFTSGTTGQPKGVAHTFGSEFGNAEAFNAAMGFGPENRFLHFWPMAYSTGYLNTLLSPFMAGGSVVLSQAFSAQTILSFWKPALEHFVNTLWLSPTMMTSLLRLDRDAQGTGYSRTHLRAVCVGTAPLPARVKADFESKYGVETKESYGLSELLIIATNTPGEAGPPDSVGRLLPGVEFAVRADAGEMLAAGDEGEVMIRTPFAAKGYLSAETGLVETKDSSEWFATGDIGRIDGEGRVYITGRKKDLIIRGGQNLSPRAIHDVLLEHPAVEEAAVCGLPHDFYGEEVAAAVKLREGRSLEEEKPSILEHCRRNLSHAAVPTRMVQWTEFPLGATGKILVREVRARLLAQAAGA